MAMPSAFIDGALQDIELLGKDFLKKREVKKEVKKEVTMLRWYLRFLRTFLLCARGCGSSPTGSLLSRLQDLLIQNGKDFHNLCLRQEETRSTDINVDLYGVVMQLNNCIISFYQEIMESYNILLKYCSLQFRYQLKEFFDSLLVNMADIVICSGLSEEPDPFEAFKNKLEFFINFVRYAELRGLEPCQLQVLFTRLHAVAVNTARLCYQFPFVGYGGPHMLFKEIKLKVSEQLPKIEPIDPQIREIYVHVLTTSNLSPSSHALTLETDKHVLGDFVDTLLSNILKALVYGDSYMVSLKDQVPILYEGLRFLRTILTKHLEKTDQLHKKAKDLIGAAVNEAAIVICLLPLHKSGDGLVKEMDFALLNFLERIKLIKVITSAFIFPKSNKHVFIDFLLENLDEVLSCKVDLIAFAKDQIQTVQKDLVSLRSFLENILDDRKHDGEVQSLWNRVVEVACKTHFVLLSLVVGDAPNCSPLKFQTIIEEINLIKLESLKIVDKHCTSDSKSQKAANTSNPLPLQGSMPAINETTVILHDEANTIIEYLTIGGSKNLDIISIVGMPGLGKTTLARTVYDNPSVRDLFHASAWCVVSQAYKKKDLLLRILGSVDPEFPSNKNSEMSDDDYLKKDEQWLEEKLRKCLLRRRYLIILDDVWDIEVWSCLQRSFPDDANSSRILLTSRDSKVVKKINPNREPHCLRQLNDNECWNLLQKKLSCIKSYPLDLGEKIAKQCRGLPLTVVVIAGILANSEQDSWEEIAERLSLSALSIIDQCIDILELSFNKLPENLKSCLLYFGLLPEDEEIPVRNLIWFWLAEGFIENSEQKSLEDVAEDYINDLIGRSLVMVFKERSIGGVKTCRIHDLLHEFCVIKAKEKRFMSLIRGYDELFTFHGQRDLPLLCVYSTQEEFKHSKISCPGVRSLLFFAVDDGFVHDRISVLLQFFKLLKVLDLKNIQIETVPSEMALLVELRYLAITIKYSVIPLAVANLSNLEFLLVYQNCVLPDAIWNMPKLRVLWSPGLILFTALALDNLENSSDLLNLDVFSTLRLCHGQSLEKTLRKLPNIRRLKCELEESGESNADSDGHVVMDFLSRLESLHLRCDNDECHIRFRFPLNLKKLTLTRFHSSTIPKSEELPNLVVLKLEFVGGAWDMNEEWVFPNLKFLQLCYSEIDRWTGTDGVNHFPCLEKLVLENCWNLKEVPSCFGEIGTLETIEMSYCPKSVASSILQIKEYQKDNWGKGDEDLRVLLTNIQDDPTENEVEDDRSESENEVEDETSDEE